VISTQACSDKAELHNAVPSHHIISHHVQWRRQTIKSGSAFKGQLYFQVGQTERWSAPTLGVLSEEERRSPSPLRGLGYAPSKFCKNQL